MYDAISLSDDPSGPAPPLLPRVSPAPGPDPVRRWSDGAAEVAVGLRNGESRLRHLYQSDPCRVLFPHVPASAPMEVVLVTTSGGIVGGDRLRFQFEAHEGSTAAFTAQAAEKVYRSAGAVSELSVSVTAHDGAFLEWMPQETILFDGARMRRRNRADLSGTGRILTGEIVVFGRRARGETFSSGYLHDEWRVYRDGRLAWADALHLDGDTGALIDNRFAFGGAAAVGTLIYAGGDAEAQLAAARANVEAGAGGVRCAATRIGDVLVVRFLGADAATLRTRFADLWKTMRHAVAGYPARLPRVWEV